MATEPRMTGPGVVADTALGTHECLFYDTKEDLLDALIPYFRSGLADSQAGLWIVSEPLALSDATEALRRLSVSPDSSPNHAGIEIISFTEWYLAGGTFDLRRVLQRFQEKLAAARASGYSGLRCTGDAGWLGGRGRKKLHEYETALGRSLLGQDTRVLCTHPLAACSATDVLDAEHIHGRAATIRTGVWRVLKAPRSWPSADKASKLDQHQLEDKVTDGTRTLRATNEELIQEIAERRQVEAELRTQKEVLQQIFDHIPVMINVLDSNGRVLMVNREWECTLGWTLEETKTDNVNVLAECYPDQRYQESVLEFLANSRGEWKELRTRTRDGRVIDTSWAVVRLSDGRVLGIGRDITNKKQSDKQLQTTMSELRALSASMEAQREEERSRIARLIHDELGSILTSLKWDLGGLDKTLSQGPDSVDPETLRNKIATMIQLADTAIETVRSVASQLRPSILDDLGLVEAIEWQARQFEARTCLVCRCEGSYAGLRFSTSQSTAVFRILQESLTNILRHARATRVDIRMAREAAEFVLEIRDNGKGISGTEKSGLGILGMKERARLLSGRIEIQGTEGKGTTIIVRIPITVQVADHEANPHR